MHLPHESVSKYTFRADRLARLSELEHWHFWFAGRQILLDQFVGNYMREQSIILDVGCGTGRTTGALMRRGYRVLGLDLRPEGLQAARQTMSNANLFQAEASHLPLADNFSDAAILLDVLEHVDDGVLLNELKRVLKPGGVVAITVPALPWLWSYRDQAAGHLRRYTRQQLCQLVVDANFQVQEIHYYQCLLLPLVILTRLLGRRTPHLRDMEEQPAPVLNALLTWINQLEARLGTVIRWPWGSSLMIVCQSI